MAQVLIDHITKEYSTGAKEPFKAVNDLSLKIRDKEFVVLVGPSGCGKTTTLRMIAGLEDISKGEIWIGDKVVNNVKPKDRDIAMVFQSYALYPHMSVYENMAFALKMRKMDKKEIDSRVKEAAKILNIETQLEKKPKALSGGQRQRVALGRAIVRKPSVFLMDEPLSNLDAKLRVRMRIELKRIHREMESTTVYVTHDQMEAMTLGDKMAIMNAGNLQQYAHPMQAYGKPANTFVATFVGSPSMNLIGGTISMKDDKKRTFDAGELKFDFSGGMADAVGEHAKDGGSYSLGIRPEDVVLSPTKIDNGVKGKVFGVELLGDAILAYVGVGKAEIIAQVGADKKLSIDDEVYLDLTSQKAHVFEQDVKDKDDKVKVHGKLVI